MKTRLLVTLNLALLIAGSAAMGQAPSQPPALGSIQVKGTRLVEIDASHVRVGVDLTVTPSQSATLKNMHLCALRLNGLPVFAAAVDEEIVLHKDVPTALPTVYVTVYFRDLSTVEPLRRMVEKQSVHIQGELLAEVRLSFLEKLALHTQHPQVIIPLNQDVPADVGGTEWQRSLALGALTMLGSSLDATAKAGKDLPGLKPDWIRDFETAAQSSVFGVESKYSLTEGGASYPVISDGIGFQVTSGRIVTTADQLEPWKYDVEFAAAIKSGTAKLGKNNLEIELHPIGGKDTAFRMSTRDFSAEARGNPEDNPISAVSSAYGRVQVNSRATPATLAVLTLHKGPFPKGLLVAPFAIASKESWEKVAVLRLRLDPATRKLASFEVLQMTARRNGKSIVLSEPVDSSVFGSPIMTPDGAIGVVQDEEVGTVLPADLLIPDDGSGA